MCLISNPELVKYTLKVLLLVDFEGPVLLVTSNSSPKDLINLP